MRKLQVELLLVLSPGLIMALIGFLIGGILLQPAAFGPWLKAALPPLRFLIMVPIGGIILSVNLMKYYKIIRNDGVGSDLPLAACISVFGLVMPTIFLLYIGDKGILGVASYFCTVGILYSCFFGIPLLRTIVYELLAL